MVANSFEGAIKGRNRERLLPSPSWLVDPDYTPITPHARIPAKLGVILQIIAEVNQPEFPQTISRHGIVGWNGVGLAGYSRWLDAIKSEKYISKNSSDCAKSWSLRRQTLAEILRVTAGSRSSKFHRRIHAASEYFHSEASELLRVSPTRNRLKTADAVESITNADFYCYSATQKLRESALTICPGPPITTLFEHDSSVSTFRILDELLYAARSGPPIIKRLTAIALAEFDGSDVQSVLKELAYSGDNPTQYAALSTLFRTSPRTVESCVSGLEKSDNREITQMAKLFRAALKSVL